MRFDPRRSSASSLSKLPPRSTRLEALPRDTYGADLTPVAPACQAATTLHAATRKSRPGKGGRTCSLHD